MSDEVVIRITGDAAGAVSSIDGVTNSTRSLQDALSGAGASGLEAGNEISEGMKKAEYSTMEAREASRLFAEESGIRIPRALSQIAARSETLGPILAGAFSGLALLAFADLLVKSTEAMSNWIAKTFIFTDSMKAVDAALLANNNHIVEFNAKADALANAFKLIGLSGAALSSVKLDMNSDDIQKTQEQISLLQQQISGLHAGRIDTADAAPTVGLPSDATMESIVNKISGTISELNAKLEMQQQENQNIAKELGDQEAKDAETTAEKGAAAKIRWYELIVKAHAQTIKEMEDADKEEGKVAEAQGESQVTNQLKASEAAEKESEAIIKAAMAQLGLNEAVSAEAVERAKATVSIDAAQGNKRQQIVDEQALVAALEKERAAQLAIIDAKIQGAQVAMGAAQTGSPTGGLDATAYANAEAQYTEYQAQRVHIAANADKQIADANSQSLKTENAEIQKFVQQFNSEFANAFAEVAMGHETVTKAAQKMFQSMEKSALEEVAKYAATRAEKAAIDAAFDNATIAKFLAQLGIKRTAQTSSDATGTAEKATAAAAQIPINVSLAMSNSAVAATGAAAMSGLAAPITAAATMGEMAPYITIAAHDIGGMSKGGLSLLHPDEAVLTPEQTENFRQMTDNGGGDTYNTTHNHTWNTMDSKSLQDFAKRNPGFFATGVNNAVKNGHLSPSQLARGK